jgi:FlaG/FlaF family flagellin (archaellin)
MGIARVATLSVRSSRPMSSELRRLLAEEDAVAPVIGIVLVVAIVVILASIVGAFVFGIGSEVSETPPQASLSVERVDTSTNSFILNHGGSEPIETGETTVTVAVGGNTISFDEETLSTDRSFETAETANITTDDGAGASIVIGGVEVYNTTAPTIDVGPNEEYTITVVDRPSGQVVAEASGTT